MSGRSAVAAGCAVAAAALVLPIVLPLAVLTAVLRGVAGSGAITAAAAATTTAPIACPALSVARGFQLPVHAGIDLDCPAGTAEVAVAGATLRRRSDAGGSCVIGGVVHPGGYGTYAVLEPDARAAVRYIYAHLSGYAVGDGAHVRAGEVIGYEGSTGCSTGPHLHFEVRNAGIPTNPCPFLPQGYPSAQWRAAGCPLQLSG